MQCYAAADFAAFCVTWTPMAQYIFGETVYMKDVGGAIGLEQSF
jgi:hypothetical protein